MKNLNEKIVDSTAFEKFVAELHKDGTLEVQHDVKLKGKSGAVRQIDVLIDHVVDGKKTRKIIECKYLNSNVERQVVDALITTKRDLEADKIVIFAKKGFQKGAITQAEYDEVELYKVRELEDYEWGYQGRIAWWYSHAIIGNFEKIGIAAAGGNTSVSGLNYEIPVILFRILSSGEILSLEETIHWSALLKAEELSRQLELINGGADCEVQISIPIEIRFPASIITLDVVEHLFSGCTYELKLKVMQQKNQIDRSEEHDFAVGIIDCITQNTLTAGRILGEENTRLRTARPGPGLMPHEKTGEGLDDVTENGSIAGAFGLNESLELDGDVERHPLEVYALKDIISFSMTKPKDEPNGWVILPQQTPS